jgi:hypothetical protein
MTVKTGNILNTQLQSGLNKLWFNSFYRIQEAIKIDVRVNNMQLNRKYLQNKSYIIHFYFLNICQRKNNRCFCYMSEKIGRSHTSKCSCYFFS